MKLFKSSLSVLFAVGFFASVAAPASAQLEGGNIRMGANGPVGSFNTGLGNFNVGSNGATGSFTTGALNGRFNIGSGGGNVNTNLGNFGFDMPGGQSGIVSSPTQGGVNYGANGGIGPQGQAPGGYSTGIGSFGSAASSQAVMGDRSNESLTTNTKFQGDSGRTQRNNNTIYERQETNLLSTFSFDPSAVPSGSFDYGFRTGAGAWAGTAAGAIRRGWYLPPTSTGSLDINTVSP